MNDAGDRVQDVKKTRAMAKRQGWSTDKLERKIHKIGLEDMKSDYAWRSEELSGMQLKSLVFNVEDLFCPRGCCRHRMLEIFCKSMGREGPWHRLEADEEVLKECRKTRIKVLGLQDDSEKEIFMEIWGLEV